MNRPFLLKPAAKSYLWGGNRLNDDFGKNINETPLAETWECSTHPDGQSIVASGEYTNQRLGDVLRDNPSFLGKGSIDGDLPILIKLIDAKDDLSVQVHPDDKFAFSNENGQMGKTEMWYVLDAAPNSKLIYGLTHNLSKEQLKESINRGTLEKYLQKIPVKKDDVFFIEPGTIHAIGSGILVAEVQENSNLTYRLFDYNRVDKNCKKRELHIDKALEVSKLTKSERPRQPIRVLNYTPGCALELLARCRYFEVNRMVLNTERHRAMVSYQTHETYSILLCYSGCGVITMNDCELLPFFKGDCIFFPANSIAVKIHGKAEFLDIKG